MGIVESDFFYFGVRSVKNLGSIPLSRYQIQQNDHSFGLHVPSSMAGCNF